MATLVSDVIGSYEDSWQPTGNTKIEGWSVHFEMKKLVHKLILIVEGPDDGMAAARAAVNQAAAAGLVAAISAVFLTGGAALALAEEAVIASLTASLGGAFQVRVDNDSHWEFWWT